LEEEEELATATAVLAVVQVNPLEINSSNGRPIMVNYIVVERPH
jgi:hypothetical protein